MCAYMNACVCILQYTDQRTTCRSQFSFSTAWVLGIELRSSARREAPCLSYLTSPSLVSYRWKWVFRGEEGLSSLFRFFGGVREGTQHLVLARQVFCHWAMSPAPVCTLKWWFWLIGVDWIIGDKRNQLEDILSNLGQRWCDRHLK